MEIIGELINASRKTVASQIESRDSEAVQQLARNQFKAGAAYIDVNAGVCAGEESAHLEWLIPQVQAAVAAPCCIDSPDPKAIEAALKVHRGIAMINSISLEKERFAQLLPIVAGTDLKVVALCMSEEGMPETADQRVAIADKLINALVQQKVALENIYVDPLVQPISVNQHFGLEFLEAVERIMTGFPGVHTVCGLSNISYGLPNRKLLNRQFMAMAITKGLDAAIVNPLDREMMQVVSATGTLAGKDAYCQDYLNAQREIFPADAPQTTAPAPLAINSGTGAINSGRMAAAIDFQVADQIPFTLNVNGPFFAYYYGIPVMDYYDSPQKMLAAQLSVYYRFGQVTALTSEMSLAPEASALGATINWSDDGTAWVEPCIETEADVDALELPDLKNAGYMTKIFEYYDYMTAQVGDMAPIILGTANSPFTIAALMRGTSEFIGDLVLAPQFASKLLRKCTDMVLCYLKEQERIVPPERFKRILLFDDLSGFVNLELFRKFVVPIYKEIYGAFPQCQRWYHNDSDATHVLPGIAEAGIQVFHYGYQVDAAYAKALIGDRVCLMGNIPPLEVLRNGRPAEVEAAVERVVAASGHGGGLIMAAGGYIDEGTPIENIEAMIDACRRYGKKDLVSALPAPDQKAAAACSPTQQAAKLDPTAESLSILEKIKHAVVAGSLGEIQAHVQAALSEEHPPQKILDEGIVAGMDEVGSQFSTGEIFIPEMMMAAKCTKLGMEILNPLLAGGDGGKSKKGRIAIGTVKEDLHDIGKDIVVSMMQGAGLEVIDLGVDCAPEAFCQAVADGAQLVGLSAILTTVIPNMKATVDLLEAKGLRRRCKILIGGAAVTSHTAAEVGADAYCEDGGEGVRVAKRFLAELAA